MLNNKNKKEKKQSKQPTIVLYEKPKLIRSTNEYPPLLPKINLFCPKN